MGELTAPTYTFVRGQFQLEDKDQVKARLGRSCDLADALALTFAVPEPAPRRMAAARHSTTVDGLRRHGRVPTLVLVGKSVDAFQAEHRTENA